MSSLLGRHDEFIKRNNMEELIPTIPIYFYLLFFPNCQDMDSDTMEDLCLLVESGVVRFQINLDSVAVNVPQIENIGWFCQNRGLSSDVRRSRRVTILY